MKIDTSQISVNRLQMNTDEKKVTAPGEGFDKFFDAAINMYEETNNYEKEYEKMQIDYVTGKTDDIIALTMAGTRASSSVQFTAQVTNKVISAYQEIMRMQM